MTQTMPYHVAVDDNEVVIRADRSLFDAVALTKLLDYLLNEAQQRRRQATAVVDPMQIQLQQEVAAYTALHPQLLAHHQGEWVAIYQGQLLDHDRDEGMLMQRLAAHQPDALPLVRQVEEAADRELYIPSFRLVA